MIPRLEDNRQLRKSAEDMFASLSQLVDELRSSGDLDRHVYPVSSRSEFVPHIRTFYDTCTRAGGTPPGSDDILARIISWEQIDARMRCVCVYLAVAIDKIDRIDPDDLQAYLSDIRDLIRMFDDFPDRITGILLADPTRYLRDVLRALDTGDSLRDVPIPYPIYEDPYPPHPSLSPRPLDEE